MTKDERDAIRAIHKEAQQATKGWALNRYQHNLLREIVNCVSALLDALEGAEAQICYKCHDANVNDEDGIIDILRDRDRWKAKAEALERAINHSKDCDICSNISECNKYPCYCINGDAFHFDESRFAAGTGETPECDTCVHNPPSPFGGKPCCQCSPESSETSCYQKAINAGTEGEE